ncbi:unnamed protein product [Brachionus calyciflorus]|uniref:G-protein coupled receptors family 1 profile domain-containing protein n=1 Tax=Brachionus calyciflorus TaxID=104777 RepID=A0A814DU83_9BILA|nr:unnamed protein product [Brachionus calyciflorus]
MNSTYDKLFEWSTILNIYACSLFVLIGCFGGLITLMVFCHARGRLPKIGAHNYLGILTIANCIFLVLHWLINTTQIIISYLELSTFSILFLILNTVNTNEYTCKIMNFTCTFTRSLSTYLTLTFSFERTISIYFPFKIITHKQNCIFKIVLIFLIILSSLVSFKDYQNYKLIKFSNQSLILCEIPEDKFQSHLNSKLIFTVLTLLFPIFLIILLNISILFRMNRKKNYLNVNQYFSFNVKTTQKLRRFLSIKTEVEDDLDDNTNGKCYQLNESIMIHKANCEENEANSLDGEVSNLFLKKNDNFCIIKIDLDKERKEKGLCFIPKPHLVVLNKNNGQVSLYEDKQRSEISVSKVEFVRNSKTSPNSSINSVTMIKESSLCNDTCKKKPRDIKKRRTFKIHCINHKFYKTKILIILTSLYVISNIPYFLSIHQLPFNNINTNGSYSNGVDYYARNIFFYQSNEYVFLKCKFHTYLLLSEILYVFNYSISGFLLFSYGKIYRLHLMSLLARLHLVKPR